MQWKRLVFFLLINIFVSALTTTVVLVIWDSAHRPDTTELENNGPGFVIPKITQVPANLESDVRLQPYQVTAGETLGEIALQFDITVEELLVINGFSDANSIGSGTTIVVPVAGEDTVEIPREAEEAAPPTNTGEVEIVGIFGAGDLASERVQIRGFGEGNLSLAGWRLRDEDGNEYIFPQITLFGNGAVDVYSAAGVDTVVSLYWRSGQPIWNQGETVTLTDQDGNVKSIYTLP